jgi:hypothetical protein
MFDIPNQITRITNLFRVLALHNKYNLAVYENIVKREREAGNPDLRIMEERLNDIKHSINMYRPATENRVDPFFWTIEEYELNAVEGLLLETLTRMGYDPERAEEILSMDSVLPEYGNMMRPKHGNGFLYFDNTQPQRHGGYNRFYETVTSNEIVCDIDSIKTDFINTWGRVSSVWLWKGDYNMVFDGGWHIGAEVGVYTNGLADDNIFKSVSWELINNIEIASIKHMPIISRTLNGQYWINAFVKGQIGAASNLILEATIDFINIGDAINYETALKTQNISRLNYFSSNTPAGDNRNPREVILRCLGRNNSTVRVYFK